MTRGRKAAAGCAALLAFAAVGCKEAVDVAEEAFEPETPHEAYAWGLEQAGLAGSALARDWLMAAERALQQPIRVAVPFRETGYLPPDEATAMGFRIDGRRGQRVVVDFLLATDPTTTVFVDVYRLSQRRNGPVTPERYGFAKDGERSIVFEPRRDEAYIIRLQPELLRGGRYTVTITAGPSLAFPVEGAGDHDIGSFFGDSRDGGSRNHHGIDIFAARMTPALAATEAVVHRVQTTPVGGKVVWLRDERRGARLYYAHLDSQNVRRGMRVRPGDTIGFVGNTGNARTTPPHLHFGVYSRGPVDPLPWVLRPGTDPPGITADLAALGRWMRSARDGLTLRVSPDARADSLFRLPRHTAVRVFAGTGDWYRVTLPDGTAGFVIASGLEPADRPIRAQVLPGARTIHAHPVASAVAVGVLGGGQSVDVLGTFASFLLVPGPAGRPAWLAAAAEDND